MNPISILTSVSGGVAALFSGPWALLAKWGVIALLIAAFGGWAWFKGNEHGTQKLNNYIAKQAIESVRISAAREKIVTVTEIKYRDKVKTVYAKGETIVKEVPIHVTQADDAGCVVPVGFVREFNAAWSNAPAGPAAESDRGPSGVPLSEVASTEAANATSCLVYKTQRDGLIDFYRKQQAVK